MPEASSRSVQGQCKCLEENVQLFASIVPWADHAHPCAASAASLVMFLPLQTEMSAWAAGFGKMSVWQDVGRSPKKKQKAPGTYLAIPYSY